MSPTAHRYCIDTNCWLKMRYYYIETFASFWKNLEQLISEGRLFVPEQVIVETKSKIDPDDPVHKWLVNHPEIVVDLDPTQANLVRPILNHNEKWRRDAETSEKPNGDPYVIALAQAQDLIVVTEEHVATYNGGANNAIPAVCQKLQISHLCLKDFMVQEGWRF